MRPTMEKIPCLLCGEEVTVSPTVVFGAYHRECWTKMLHKWVEMKEYEKGEDDNA